MSNAKQEQLVRFMEQHELSARDGARLVGMILRKRWLFPLPGAAQLRGVDWYSLNPPLNPECHDFPLTSEES